MKAFQTNKVTKDGLTIYDLAPLASELWAVAGPAGHDPTAIDTDNLPAGFRWVKAWEFSEPQAFILVFRPHQDRAWADAFETEQDFVRAWGNGVYDRSCSANNDLTDEESELTYDNAFGDCAHDLHCITRLDSPEEVEAYLESRQHNMAIDDVVKAAKRLDWIDDYASIDD
jgi:hypothetical protein